MHSFSISRQLAQRVCCVFATPVLGAALLFAPGAEAQPNAAPPPLTPAQGSEAPPPTAADTAAGVEPAPTDEATSVAIGDVAPLRAELVRQSAELERQRVELEQQKTRSAALEQAQLMALSAPLDADQYEEKLRFYGFVDVGLQKLWLGDRAIANAVMESTAATFVLGNINLYMDARPTPGWRALTEVRFTTYPQGQFTVAFPGATYQRTSTAIQDTNNSSGGWARLNWGTIVVERAQLEWSGADWLNVTAGYWFTPYGIWNVDHGNPTLIALNEPMFVVFEAFPARQLGVDVTGTFHTPPWDLEYHAYVSNGRTPGQLDLSNDKMLGARVVARLSSPFQLALGGSGFFGNYRDHQVRITALTPVITYDHAEVVAGREWGVSADVSADVGPWRFRSEFALNETRWNDGKHPTFLGFIQPSNRLWGAYGLLAHQLPWAGLEPYVYFEYDRNVVPQAQAYTLTSAGLNVHFTPAAQLKLQYAHYVFFDIDELGRDFTGTQIDCIFSRLVVAF